LPLIFVVVTTKISRSLVEPVVVTTKISLSPGHGSEAKAKIYKNFKCYHFVKDIFGIMV
jgi:hypothetical protein